MIDLPAVVQIKKTSVEPYSTVTELFKIPIR